MFKVMIYDKIDNLLKMNTNKSQKSQHIEAV